MNVLIINHCSTNKGDRAVLYALLRELDRNNIKNVTVSTGVPAFWNKGNKIGNLNLKFIPFGWNVFKNSIKPVDIFSKIILKVKDIFYRKFFFVAVRDAFLNDKFPWYLKYICDSRYWKALHEADAVIGTGGHRVTTLLAKDAVFSATFDMTLALILNKPLILWSQTIGPLKFENIKNKRLIRKILKKANKIYIRDDNSKLVLAEQNINDSKISETPESVFSLFDLIQNVKIPSKRENIVGISVYMAQKRSHEENDNYVNSLAFAIDHLAEKGYRIWFFPMELEGADLSCINNVICRVKHKNVCSVIDDYPETTEHLKLISDCKFFIGHKTHSIVFSLTVGTPVLAIAYHKKSEDFMNQYKLTQYSIPDEEISGPKLIELSEDIINNLDQIYKKEKQVSIMLGIKAQNDFSTMINSICN